MTRTPTLPLDSAKMWRLLMAATHPDTARGSHELCIFVQALKEHVFSGLSEEAFAPSPPRPEPAWASDPERIPYPSSADFAALTQRAVIVAEEEPLVYCRLLRALRDCEPLPQFADKQQRGASYKQLAAIAHQAGMSKTERVQWYRVAESIPLSDRHAGHLLGKLKRQAA